MITSNEYSEIERLARTGAGSRKIAIALNKHPSTIYKILKRIGLLNDKPNQHAPDYSSISLNAFNSLLVRKFAIDYCVAYFGMRGYELARPTEEAPFDLLILIDGKWCKIQIKTSGFTSNGHNVFSLVKVRHNSTGTRKVQYTNDNCDYFYLLSDTLIGWFIPYGKLANSKTVTPAVMFSGYKCG